MQTSVSVTVTVTNTGNAAFNGNIDVYYATDTAYVPVLLGTIPSASLTPGNSVDLTTNILIDSSHFNMGSNIVVVWGTGSGISTSDQTWRIIYVDTLAGAGIAHLYFDGNIRIYPNPVLNTLTIEYTSAKNTIESIRVFDLPGGNIPAVTSSSVTAIEKTNVDVSSLPSGMYFLEIENSDGRYCNMKFVKYSR